MNSNANRFNPVVLTICAFLVLITWIVFGRTVTHDFVNYDDRAYVYGNLTVGSGITWTGLVRAFSSPHANNWHPLTTISHMVDSQLFGLHAGFHHAVNVLLHSASVVLLFLVLLRLTGGADRAGNPWRCAFVAALFAIHPLRAESVAWIAERKDVLSALFFMLTLGAYERFIRERTWKRYLVLFAMFVCGLMSKPMLVTVPIVLLLLDYWPLRRIDGTSSLGPALMEKLPLLGLSLASCAATVLAAKHNVVALEALPLGSRLANAIVSYFIYIGEMIFPANLAVFYPFHDFPAWQTIVAAVSLIGITSAAVIWRRRWPHVFTGWFWYLVMLLPVIGIYQIGLQGHADRYTYLPQIGLYLLITWSVAELSIFRRRPEVLAGIAPIVILMLGVVAWNQVSYWKDSKTLWSHTLEVTSDNDVAHNNFGFYFQEQGNADESLAHYREALRIESARNEPRYSLSRALTYTNIGNVLSAQGRLAEGVMQYEQAIKLRPEYADAHYNLGKTFLAQGRFDDAISHWQTALSVQPDDSEAHNSLAGAFLRKKMLLEAIYHYEKAIAAPVPSVYALNNLAWVLSTAGDASTRNGAKAIALARTAVTISRGESPNFLRTLGAAYAETGDFEDAIKAAERALELARKRDDVDLANDIEEDLSRYRMKAPVRDPNLAVAPANTDADPNASATP